MLKVLKLIFGAVTIILAIYGLITGNFAYQAYTSLSLGVYLLISGLEQWQKSNRLTGWLLIVMFFLSLYVSIQSFILN